MLNPGAAAKATARQEEAPEEGDPHPQDGRRADRERYRVGKRQRVSHVDGLARRVQAAQFEFESESEFEIRDVVSVSVSVHHPAQQQQQK